jgi:acetoin utilization deacetylase AcuC-like enzyme
MRVYYRSEQVADGNQGRFSPSAAKPKKVFQDWLNHLLKIEVKKPFPVSRKDLYEAHDKKYVDGVLDGEISNGFGDTGQDVIDSLPFTVGSMVAATKHAFKTGEPAAALCSGFHHAGWDFGGGFCTFNGLIVAALAAKKAGAKKVGILDCDYHYGNGTDDIIKRKKWKWLKHFTAGHIFCGGSQAEMFLDNLENVIKSNFWDCDVLIYQAGSDPFIGDPLGGFLTIEQLKKRDEIVFKTAKKMRLAVAWNLAGGYTKDEKGDIPLVLEIHRNTAQACIDAWEGDKHGV